MFDGRSSRVLSSPPSLENAARTASEGHPCDFRVRDPGSDVGWSRWRSRRYPEAGGMAHGQASAVAVGFAPREDRTTDPASPTGAQRVKDGGPPLRVVDGA